MTVKSKAIKEIRTPQDLDQNSSNAHSYDVSSAFTVGNNVQNPSNLRRKCREDIIDAIRTGVAESINVKGKVCKIRNLPFRKLSAKDEAEERARLKRTLPWFSGGLFYLKRSLDELMQTNYIIIDVDNVEDPESTKQLLNELDDSLDFAFTSPSHGLKLVYRMDMPMDDDISPMRAFRYLADDLLSTLGLVADEGAKSLAQACYFSHDPDLWENPQCKPLDLSSIPVPEKQGPAKIIDFPKVEKPVDMDEQIAGQRVSTFEEDYATAQRIVQHLVNCGEISYDHWRKTAYAIKARFGEWGREIFLLYAENNAYHDDRVSLIRYWDSLGTPTRVSFPSLVWVAKQYGWPSA